MWNDKDYSTNGGRFRHPDHVPMDPEVSYSVAETARIFAVDKQTVMKWLSPDDSGEAVLDSPKDWYKLPGSGYIRIRKSAIMRLQMMV